MYTWYMYKPITNLWISGQSEFPSTFPCDWINKTFTLFYTNRLNSIEPLTNMTFNADGTTGTLFSELKTQCFQISDEFLILRVIRYWYKEWQYWQYICNVRKKFSFFLEGGGLEDLRVGVETLFVSFLQSAYIIADFKQN